MKHIVAIVMLSGVGLVQAASPDTGQGQKSVGVSCESAVSVENLINASQSRQPQGAQIRHRRSFSVSAGPRQSLAQATNQAPVIEQPKVNAGTQNKTFQTGESDICQFVVAIWLLTMMV